MPAQPMGGRCGLDHRVPYAYVSSTTWMLSIQHSVDDVQRYVDYFDAMATE